MFGPLAVAVAIAVPAPAPNNNARPFDDAAFLRMVAAGGMYDGRLGYLVGPQARTREVRKLAACVVADGLVGSTALKAAAESAGVELPTALDDIHRKQYKAFEGRTGEEMEREFVRAMAERRAAGVVLFTRASRDATHPEVRAFATRMLPLLREHAMMADGLNK